MMDNDELNRVIEKTKMKIAISNFKTRKEEVVKVNWTKMIATFAICIGIAGSLVYATETVAEKIWNVPKEKTFSYKISEQEKNEYISEKEALIKGEEYLKLVGWENEKIKNINLMRDFRSYEAVWTMNAGYIRIKIDAKNGDLIDVQIPSYAYKIPYDYAITKEEARIVAKELLNKYKPKDDNSEYELVSLKGNGTEEFAYIWYADFYKKYGNLTNKYESIRISWVPTINGLYYLEINKDKYENNEEKITKEQAITIATEKDNQIENNKIINTIAELRIRKMNDDLYRRENFSEEYYKNISSFLEEGQKYYETEEKVRKVWCVVLEYETKGREQALPAYTYYVDATTGEIIGGAHSNEFYSEQALKNDEYNLIER